MLTKFYFNLYNLLHSEEGQDLAEYAILIALIALVVILAVVAVGTNISTIISRIGSSLGNNPVGS